MAYTFANINFETEHNIGIERVSGHLGFPQRKRPTEYDFEDIDGSESFTEETDIKWEARDIILQCHMDASTIGQFYDRHSKLINDVLPTGLHTLSLTYAQNDYRCYYRQNSPFNRLTQWNSSKNVGQFKLVFREPVPSYPAVWRGLVGHWSCNDDDGAGVVQTDLSVNSNNLTMTVTTYAADRGAVTDGALTFDGATIYGDTATTFETAFQDSFSMTFWCKPDDGQPATAEYFLGAANSPVQDAIYCRIPTSGKLQFYYESDNDGKSALTSAAVFSDGAETWHHVACVANNDIDQLSIFLDGIKQTLDSSVDGDISAITMDDFATSIDLYIGAYNNNGTPTLFFAGDMHDVRVYNRALSVEEVKLIYHMEYDKGLDY